jgi:hypothetical protein
MFFEVKQPDGSSVTITPREIGMAEVWATMSPELTALLQLLHSMQPNDEIRYGERVWRRIK